MSADDLLIQTRVMTCGAVPVQIEGLLSDGRCYYFRARHRAATFGVGATPDEAVMAQGYDHVGMELFGAEWDRYALGYLDEEQTEGLLTLLFGVWRYGQRTLEEATS